MFNEWKRVDVESWTHKRSETTPTRAICGAGYDWPSSIALTDEQARVTCPNCLRLNEAEAPPSDESGASEVFNQQEGGGSNGTTMG